MTDNMRFHFRFAHAAACALLLATVSTGSLGADPKTKTVSDPGWDIFLRHCSSCHGEKGDSKSIAQKALAKRPRDFTAPESRQRLTREYMIAIVRDGRPHTPMTARASRLSQKEIETVVDYIRARFMSAERRDPPPAKGK